MNIAVILATVAACQCSIPKWPAFGYFGVYGMYVLYEVGVQRGWLGTICFGDTCL